MKFLRLALPLALLAGTGCYLPPDCLQEACCLHSPVDVSVPIRQVRSEAPEAAPTPSTNARPGPATSRNAAPATSKLSQEFDVNWKERVAQGYVYLDYKGDYRQIGARMRQLFQLGETLPVDGPPFTLFYDDPATTPLDELRARVCLPVTTPPTVMPPDARFEVLPRSLVAYARVAGPYNALGRSYRSLFDYMRKLGWQASGPIREIYLMNPGEVPVDELIGEVQVPCTVASRR